MISDFHRFGPAQDAPAGEKAMLLCFYGQDDATSRQMTSLLTEVANIFGAYLDVVPLEVGTCRNLAGIYQVRDALPHLVLVVDGVPLGRLTGPRRRREIAAFLSRRVGPAAWRSAPSMPGDHASFSRGRRDRGDATAPSTGGPR